MDKIKVVERFDRSEMNAVDDSLAFPYYASPATVESRSGRGKHLPLAGAW